MRISPLRGFLKNKRKYIPINNDSSPKEFRASLFTEAIALSSLIKFLRRRHGLSSYHNRIICFFFFFFYNKKYYMLVLVTILIPLPPPPAEAFNNTGKPILIASDFNFEIV